MDFDVDKVINAEDAETPPQRTLRDQNPQIA
jgi:hypothetical protein